MQLKPNTLLQGGKYRIERVLGQGGFGITYQAVQVELNRKVVIKEYCERDLRTGEISTSNCVKTYMYDFVKKARLVAGVPHPNIVYIYDIFEENGTAYYVADYIEDGNLMGYLSSCPSKRMSEDDVLQVAVQIGGALSFLHSKNIFHLGVTPLNILIDKKAKKYFLEDFGLATKKSQDDTSAGPIGYTLFSPLEQRDNQIQLAPTLDIYALGATLYTLLTGERPPWFETLLNEGFPDTLSKMGVSHKMQTAITKAMNIRCKDRPQSVDEFLHLLSDDKPKGQSICSVHEDEVLEETNIEVVGVEKKYFNVLSSGTLLHGHSYTYEIVKVLGQGTFGISYLANVRLSGALGELQSTVQVAIKEFFMKDVNGRQGYSVTSGSDSEIYRNYRNDFMREANNLAKMKHPHIVKVLEAFEANNTCYFSMEYINGGNLNEYILQCQSLSEREALQGIVEIGEALSFMHDNKMLHLDLKPLNVMRRKDGGLVLIDFGLSKQFGGNGEPETSTRIGLGTSGYAPLEQANYKKGEGFPATLDIYALGATLFKMLTGMTPPNAPTLFNEGFPEDDLHQCGVSDEVISLISWAMEPMKRKRPQTVKEFLDEAKRLLPDSSDTKKVKAAPRDPQRRQARSVVEGAEQCNGFTVSWKPGLKDSQKNAIRRLLGSMRKVDEIKEYANNEYGNNEYITHPVTSSCCYISSELYDQIMGVESTVGYFGPKNFTISGAVQFLLKLQQYTGLPFRFSRGEYRDEHSAPAEFWRENPSLRYLPEKGFVYDDHRAGGEKLVQSYEDFSRTYCLEIACDRMSPMIVGGRLNVPWTQITYNQLEPIGLGFYKAEVNGQWSIVTPDNTWCSLLKQEYDKVSCVDLYTIPGPGGARPSFLGVKAYCGNRIACYELKNGKFNLLTEMSKKEWEEREAWT